MMIARQLAKVGVAARAVAALAALGILSATVSHAEAQLAATQRARVVIQVSDSDQGKWNLALNNAKNIQTDLGAANVDIEIVTYGPGIDMLKLDSPVGGRIVEATTAGVKVLACENTMRGQKLTRADMLNGIGYVPAGVVELMSRQQQGWAYIRP
jgi:intracellular sulfur oxidation DsrE/DsrF family protein